MKRDEMLDLFVNSMPEPVVITDMEHKMLYLNREAIDLFEGGEDLVGKSIFDCHNEESKQTMEDILVRLKNGEDEVHITTRQGEDPENRQQTYMRAIRTAEGKLVGYYERYMTWGKRID